MARKKITHYQASNEPNAQDAFAMSLLKQFSEQSGEPVPVPVDNSAWKPAEAPRQHFPWITVGFCILMIAGVVWAVLS